MLRLVSSAGLALLFVASCSENAAPGEPDGPPMGLVVIENDAIDDDPIACVLTVRRDDGDEISVAPGGIHIMLVPEGLHTITFASTNCTLDTTSCTFNVFAGAAQTITITNVDANLYVNCGK